MSMKKKKRHSSVPRHKRLKKKDRLQAAVHWIPKYNGNNLVHGYAKHFGLNKLSALVELGILGYKIEEKYKQQLQQVERKKEKAALERKRKAEEDELEELFHDLI